MQLENVVYVYVNVVLRVMISVFVCVSGPTELTSGRTFVTIFCIYRADISLVFNQHRSLKIHNLLNSLEYMWVVNLSVYMSMV